MYRAPNQDRFKRALDAVEAGTKLLTMKRDREERIEKSAASVADTVRALMKDASVADGKRPEDAEMLRDTAKRLKESMPVITENAEPFDWEFIENTGVLLMKIAQNEFADILGKKTSSRRVVVEQETEVVPGEDTLRAEEVAEEAPPTATE